MLLYLDVVLPLAFEVLPGRFVPQFVAATAVAVVRSADVRRAHVRTSSKRMCSAHSPETDHCCLTVPELQQRVDLIRRRSLRVRSASQAISDDRGDVSL